MSASADFLRLLWGDEPPGFVQTWDLRSRRSTYWQTTNVDLTGEIDTFTAVCTTARKHGANHRAKADQAAALCGLFLDLDVAAGKFANRTQALSFAYKFASPTITVDSGTGGIHAYYLFEKPWIFRTVSERARAKIIVQQWVALHQIAAAERFIHIDSVGDLARILRLPGTLNAKTSPPGEVVVIEHQGPRHTYSDLAKHLQHMPIVEPARNLTAVAVPGDASRFFAKLEALLANSPEFEAVWTHTRKLADDSLSAYDLSLCSLAAGAMNDAELRVLIEQHRAAFGDSDAQAKGRRESYWGPTIRKARTQGTARLETAARRAA